MRTIGPLGKFSVIFGWYDGENVRFVLDQHDELDCIVLAHWNVSPWVDMSLHLYTLFWFRAKQLLFLLLNAVCLVEKHQIIIYSFGLIRPGLEPTTYCTLSITPPLRFMNQCNQRHLKWDSISVYIDVCVLMI